VRKVFEKLRSEDVVTWHVIDASMSLDDVTSKVNLCRLFSYSTLFVLKLCMF